MWWHWICRGDIRSKPHYTTGKGSKSAPSAAEFDPAGVCCIQWKNTHWLQWKWVQHLSASREKKSSKGHTEKTRGKVVPRHRELLPFYFTLFFCLGFHIGLFFSRAMHPTIQPPLTNQAGAWSVSKKIMGLSADNSIFHCIGPVAQTIFYWSEYLRLLSLLIKW